jgi:hypothetical protein
VLVISVLHKHLHTPILTRYSAKGLPLVLGRALSFIHSKSLGHFVHWVCTLKFYLFTAYKGVVCHLVVVDRRGLVGCCAKGPRSGPDGGMMSNRKGYKAVSTYLAAPNRKGQSQGHTAKLAIKS